MRKSYIRQNEKLDVDNQLAFNGHIKPHALDN